MAVPPPLQGAKAEKPDLHSFQFAYRMSDPREHAPDLVLAAFAEDDFVPGIGRLRLAGS